MPEFETSDGVVDFGEATQWSGISIVACAVPLGWISFISPLLVTFFLMKISGVPLLEKKNSKKPDMQNTQRKQGYLCQCLLKLNTTKPSRSKPDLAFIFVSLM